MIKMKSVLIKIRWFMPTPKSEYDTPWKIILDVYLQDFLALCCPEIHAAINWRKKYYVRDSALLKLFKGKEKNSYIDKLIEVSIRDALSPCLIHIEVQSTAEVNFAQRMFNYRCRLQSK